MHKHLPVNINMKVISSSEHTKHEIPCRNWGPCSVGIAFWFNTEIVMADISKHHGWQMVGVNRP